MLPPSGNNMGKIQPLDETQPYHSVPRRENSCPRSQPGSGVPVARVSYGGMIAVNSRLKHPEHHPRSPPRALCKKIVKKTLQPSCTSSQPGSNIHPLVSGWTTSPEKFCGFCGSAGAGQRRSCLIVAWLSSFARYGWDFVFAKSMKLSEECSMRMWAQSHLCQKPQRASSILAAAFALVSLILGACQPANAFPAFARKYGLRCSACHESWPMLNYFGQKFKDNGYHIMNDRDAPIWQNPAYWPITLRIVPMWHRVSTGKVAVDTGTGVQRITTSGFDVSGLDILTAGTLEKNISFLL